MTPRGSASAAGSHPAHSPRRGAFGLAAVCASLLALALTAAPASAARTYDSQIAGFTSPFGVAVDASDNVWVTDAGIGVVDKYDPSGSFLTQGAGPQGGFPYGGFYIRSAAWDNFANQLFVADSGNDDLWGLKSDATYSGTDLNGGLFGGGCCFIFIAADNSGTGTDGDLYVAGVGGKVVRVDASGSPAKFTAGTDAGTNTLTGPFSNAQNVATDSSGNVFVVSSGVVDEFASTGAFVQAFDGTGAPGGFSGSLTGVAVDPTNGDLLVVDNGNKVIDEFDSSGAYLGQITGTDPSESTPFGYLSGGIGVNSAGFVYVIDNGNNVIDVFTPNAILPKITYGAVTNQTHTSGTLNASIDLNGGADVTSCEFQYGTDASYGTSVPCSPSTPYSSNNSVSADISGLTAETTYHYRLVLVTANGTKKAPDRTLTPSAVYSLSTDPPTTPLVGHETLNGSYTGDGSDTTYYFEYVDFGHYNSAAPDPYSAGQTTASPPGADAGTGSGVQSVSAIATLPLPYTLYHYRIVATNSFGTSYGQDQTFFSPPPDLPTVDSTSSSGVTQSGATLNAQVNPGFGPTTVRFQYGTTTSYGSQTYPTDSIGSDGVDHPASAGVSDLTPGSTYHFRAIATNFAGIVRGPDQTFTTPDLPVVAASAASNVTETSATLSASVRPGFRPTSYHFEYGTTSLYGLGTPESAPIGSDSSVHNVSAALGALVPASTYHFRVVATNAVGVTDGPDQTFTTAAPSPVVTPPPTTCKAGFVKRGSKCVKKRHHKRKHHRRRHR